jgi:hypothetical protein
MKTYKHQVEQIFVSVFLQKFVTGRKVHVIPDLPKEFQITRRVTLPMRGELGDDGPVERFRDRRQDLETRKGLEAVLRDESARLSRVRVRIPTVLDNSRNIK